MDLKSLKKIASEEVTKLQNLLMVDADVDVSVEEGEEGMAIVNVAFTGDELGYMIGNRGRHLMALQYVLGNIIRRKMRTEEEEPRIVVMVDVGGYRQQKADKVERLALQKADDARVLGEPIDLMPMSASDRRVVHTALSKFDDITTESFGEGRDRHVRITPKSEKELGIVSDSVDNEVSEEEENEQ